MFVGIDPSINSTGICILKENTTTFYNVKPRLTKKEASIEVDADFHWKSYEKLEHFKEDKHQAEWSKTVNFMRIADAVKECVLDCCGNEEVYIIQEGISYGSKSNVICDLAGLNYLIRAKFIGKHHTLDDQFKMLVIPPTEIKKFATGKGNSKKDAVIDAFIQDFGHGLDGLDKIDDLADAYWMAKYAKVMKENREYVNCYL